VTFSAPKGREDVEITAVVTPAVVETVMGEPVIVITVDGAAAVV
jgi:hypothetical protein